MNDPRVLYIWSNRVLVAALSEPMSKIFEMDCREFFSDDFGFDPILFDDTFFGEDNEESLHESVLNKFGEEGVLLMQKALCIKPLEYSDLVFAQKNKNHTRVNDFHIGLYHQWRKRMEEYRERKEQDQQGSIFDEE